MNREIKFKAWHIEKKGWIQGFNMFCFHDYFTKGVEPTLQRYNTEWKLSEVILCQYTGLNDKNNKPIYEGDIVRCTDGMPLSGRPPKDKLPKQGIRKVIFHEGAYKIGVGNDSKRYHLTSLSIRYCGLEVIGNIYENPEFLP